MTLADLRWPEVDQHPRLLLVPVGSVEQHGPHLPLDTDTRIALATCQAVPHAVVGPTIAFGASGEHETFPGTVSIGTAALRDMLVEIGRSACRWASRLVFVNGHGGNIGAIRDAVELLRYEGRDVASFHCAPSGGDAHAGRAETSMLLALAPETVATERAAAGNTAPIAELLPEIRAGSVRAVSENGVLGDPTGATAEEGRRLLDELAARLAARIERWQPDRTGTL